LRWRRLWFEWEKGECRDVYAYNTIMGSKRAVARSMGMERQERN